MKKWIIALVLLIASPSFGAGVAKFSWIPNQDGITTVYEIYCSTQSVAELAEEPHELWRSAPMDNIIDSRVHYVWDDFPMNTRHYCVAIGKGMSEGVNVTSDFSNEIDFIITPDPVDPGIPQGLRVDVTVSVNIN